MGYFGVLWGILQYPVPCTLPSVNPLVPCSCSIPFGTILPCFPRYIPYPLLFFNYYLFTLKHSTSFFLFFHNVIVHPSDLKGKEERTSPPPSSYGPESAALYLKISFPHIHRTSKAYDSCFLLSAQLMPSNLLNVIHLQSQQQSNLNR